MASRRDPPRCPAGAPSRLCPLQRSAPPPGRSARPGSLCAGSRSGERAAQKRNRRGKDGGRGSVRANRAEAAAGLPRLASRTRKQVKRVTARRARWMRSRSRGRWSIGHRATKPRELERSGASHRAKGCSRRCPRNGVSRARSRRSAASLSRVSVRSGSPSRSSSRTGKLNPNPNPNPDPSSFAQCS